MRRGHRWVKRDKARSTWSKRVRAAEGGNNVDEGEPLAWADRVANLSPKANERSMEMPA